MIVRVFDFWPFTIAPGFAFLGVFILWAMLFLGAAWLLQMLLGTSRAPERSSGGAASSTSGGLAVGTLPRETDANAIAFLRKGRPALIETLLSDAVTSGWLIERDGKVSLVADATPRSAHARLLQDEVGKQLLDPRQLLQSAERAAVRIEPEIAGRLQVSGLLRTPEQRLWVASLPIAAVLTLWLFAFARYVVREELYGAAPFPSHLTFALVGFTGLGLWSAAMTPRATPLGRRYLSFVEDASVALRDDVRAHSRGGRTHVTLTVAIEGMRAVSWLPLAALIVPFTSPLSNVSGPGSSSCGSGTDSGGDGGGGCGGGGCS